MPVGCSIALDVDTVVEEEQGCVRERRAGGRLLIHTHIRNEKLFDERRGSVASLEHLVSQHVL